MEKPNPSVLIIIVNYKVAPRVIDCLASLAQQVERYQNAHVLVVDNESNDGSYEALCDHVAQNGMQSWVSVVASDKNGGYAYGNNIGIRPALENKEGPELFWLLNPDTVAHDNAMEALVKFLQKNPEAGICGSALENEDGSDCSTCFRFPSILGEFERSIRSGIVTKLLSRWKVPIEMQGQEERVDWLPGASFMIRRSVFESIGLLDDRYFLYYEETDFCLNAKKSGWHCWYVPSSKVMHVAGESTGLAGIGIKEERPARMPQYLFDSRMRYFIKNHGVIYTFVADILWITGVSLWRIRRAIQRLPDNDPLEVWTDSIANTMVLRFFKRLF